MAAVTIEGLVKIFPGTPPVVAVDGIDLTVNEGETFGLLGPNGAGKTTTVGICTTRTVASAGHVEVAGIDVRREPARSKRQTGVVSQFNTLDRSISVWENLYCHCRYFGMGYRSARNRADELLSTFRLEERSRSMPMELSGGMAQRLQVARAVAHRPMVLFLDEPTAGLDPQSRLALWEVVRQMKQDGVTVVLTTHYMEEADELCERVAIVDHGKILVLDTPDNLRHSIGEETVIEVSLGDTRALGGVQPPRSTSGDLSDNRVAELFEVLGRIEGITRVERSSDGVIVMASAADRIMPKVMEAALPFGLRDVTIKEPSLETVFINLTGRELRD